MDKSKPHKKSDKASVKASVKAQTIVKKSPWSSAKHISWADKQFVRPKSHHHRSNKTLAQIELGKKRSVAEVNKEQGPGLDFFNWDQV